VIEGKSALLPVAECSKATQGGHVSRSSWKQTFVRVWVVLGALTFFAQCGTRMQPMVRAVMAEWNGDAPPHAAAHDAPPR
jgi:hypothetical protein